VVEGPGRLAVSEEQWVPYFGPIGVVNNRYDFGAAPRG
jgi:hypothetical protein